MGRAKHCTYAGNKGQSQGQLAKTIGRSHNFVFNALKCKENHSIKCHGPRTMEYFRKRK